MESSFQLVRTLRGLDTDLLEPIGLLHWPNNSLHQLLDLLVKSTDIGVLLGGFLVDLHGLDSAVVLGGKGIEDQVRVLIHTNEISRLELVRIHQSYQREEDSLAGRGLDDGGLANARRIEIDVGTFFGGLGGGIKVQELDYVSDEVW